MQLAIFPTQISSKEERCHRLNCFQHRINEISPSTSGLANLTSEPREGPREKLNIPIAILFRSATRRNLVRDLDIGVYFREARPYGNL